MAGAGGSAPLGASGNATALESAAKAGSDVLFHDVHAFLRNMYHDLDVMKGNMTEADDARRVELDELRRELDAERFERRDQINKLRYEFEEFVHRKLERVRAELYDIQNSERGDDKTQQKEIDQLFVDLDKLTENLFSIQASWHKLISNCLTPEVPPRKRLQDKKEG